MSDSRNVNIKRVFEGFSDEARQRAANVAYTERGRAYLDGPDGESITCCPLGVAMLHDYGEGQDRAHLQGMGMPAGGNNLRWWLSEVSHDGLVVTTVDTRETDMFMSQWDLGYLRPDDLKRELLPATDE